MNTDRVTVDKEETRGTVDTLFVYINFRVCYRLVWKFCVTALVKPLTETIHC
jgi:hypothetical protein